MGSVLGALLYISKRQLEASRKETVAHSQQCGTDKTMLEEQVLQCNKDKTVLNEQVLQCKKEKSEKALEFGTEIELLHANALEYEKQRNILSEQILSSISERQKLQSSLFALQGELQSMTSYAADLIGYKNTSTANTNFTVNARAWE